MRPECRGYCCQSHIRPCLTSYFTCFSFFTTLVATRRRRCLLRSARVVDDLLSEQNPGHFLSESGRIVTNALASASGLSRTMAISISPPSFWIRPVSRLASAQGSQLPCFHTRCAPTPPGLSVPRCQFVVGHFELLASPTRG